MPRPARITLWVSFLLAVAGFGSWLIGGPPLVMLASVAAAAIGLFVLIPYFIYRVPKPVIVVSVHLDQAVEDAVAVVRAALASIGWVETGDASVASPWASVGTSDTIAGDLVLMAMSAAAERGTVEARTAIAPRPPAGAAWSLLCHPTKPRLDDIRSIVRISCSPEVTGSTLTIGGASYVRSDAYLRTAIDELRDAVTRAAGTR